MTCERRFFGGELLRIWRVFGFTGQIVCARRSPKNMSKKESIISAKGLGSAFLMILLIAAGNFVKKALTGEMNKEDSKEQFLKDNLVSHDELFGVPVTNPNNNKVEVDFLNNGTMVIDGVVKSQEGLDSLIGTWKNSGRIVSVYVEPKGGGKAQITDILDGNAIVTMKIPFSPRYYPQK